MQIGFDSYLYSLNRSCRINEFLNGEVAIHPIAMTLKTTTWKDRNIDNLELTLEFAQKMGMERPVIYNYGPGGSVKFLAGNLPRGNTASLGRGQRLLRLFESFLRKTGLFGLTTNEPKEIARIFEPLSPREIMVFDREIKVIRAVRNLPRESLNGIAMYAALKDLQQGPVDGLADIVIALNIVSRNRDRERIMQNIAASTKVGGLICINIDDPPDKGFRKVGHCLFERYKQYDRS